jgi:protein SCO1
MSAFSNPGRVLVAVIIAAIAVVAGIWTARSLLGQAAPEAGLSATRFPVARPLQPFQLVDHRGSRFDNQSLQGHWTFLFFGYTHCPDVCPTTLSVLNSVAHKLAGTGTGARFVFVTVDPQRDTPDQLARFVTYFNGDFLGVTGAESDINRLTRQLGIMYREVRDESNPNSYLVDHTASVILVDPDGRYHAVFTPPLDADAITADFRKILEAYP